jgi:hypothetical protein
MRKPVTTDRTAPPPSDHGGEQFRVFGRQTAGRSDSSGNGKSELGAAAQSLVSWNRLMYFDCEC